MNLIAAAVFAVLSFSAFAESEHEWAEIDWSRVVPVTERPGFWDGREIKPSAYMSSRTGRIVGGNIVQPNSHPYQVGLLMNYSDGTGLCGGSVLSNRAILTAAHCPIGSSSTQVILGAHQLTNVEPTQQRLTVSPSGYRLHAAYNPSTLNNDIAILITPSPFILNQFVVPTILPTVGSRNTFAGELATVSGWGRISDNSGQISAQLRSVQNNIITNAVCEATYGSRTVIFSTLCLSTIGGRGTCGGDSGGPLTVLSSGNRVQVGVVSFGSSRGCERGYPAGFARITAFREWINTNQNP